MREVMRYLRANGYKTYIVTGGTPAFRPRIRRAHCTASRPNKSSAPP